MTVAEHLAQQMGLAYTMQDGQCLIHDGVVWDPEGNIAQRNMALANWVSICKRRGLPGFAGLGPNSTPLQIATATGYTG